MGAGLVLGDVVGVVGGQRRQVQLAAEAQQVLADAAFDGQAVVHEFEVVVAGAEDVAVAGGGGPGLVVLAEAEPGLHLAGRAAGGGDDALAVLGQQLIIHARIFLDMPLQPGA